MSIWRYLNIFNWFRRRRRRGAGITPADQFEIIINKYANNNILTDCYFIATRVNTETFLLEAYGKYRVMPPHDLLFLNEDEATAIALVMENVAFLDMESQQDETSEFEEAYVATIEPNPKNLEKINERFKKLPFDARMRRGKFKRPDFLDEF